MVMWLVGTATVTTQGLTARYDTTNEEWGLQSGQNRGPRLGHQWGLFHGHGHPRLGASRPAHPHRIPTQRVEHNIPQATTCGAQSVSQVWFYTWQHCDAAPAHARRES